MVVKTVANIIKVVLGLTLVIIGLIGGLIPIFQGWVFGISGLLILSSVFPPLRKWIDKIKGKLQSKKD